MKFNKFTLDASILWSVMIVFVAVMATGCKSPDNNRSYFTPTRLAQASCRPSGSFSTSSSGSYSYRQEFKVTSPLASRGYWNDPYSVPASRMPETPVRMSETHISKPGYEYHKVQGSSVSSYRAYNPVTGEVGIRSDVSTYRSTTESRTPVYRDYQTYGDMPGQVRGGTVYGNFPMLPIPSFGHKRK